jgi:hypothetical protein
MDLLLQEYRTAGTKRAIRDGIGLHLWTAALDSIGNWLREDPTYPTTPPKIGRDEPFQNQWRDVNPQDPEEEWSWEPPDLAEGSTFFQDRVTSLKAAIDEAVPEQDKARWLSEGLDAMRVHRGNYTEEGPQQLQLLWWEFPREHCEGLREGSSMNFLISPHGELEMNSNMTPEEAEAAGRFIDELKSLGALRPATEELKANCPLFTVDKPDGGKRCIADMKWGGSECLRTRQRPRVFDPERNHPTSFVP